MGIPIFSAAIKNYVNQDNDHADEDSIPLSKNAIDRFRQVTSVLLGNNEIRTKGQLQTFIGIWFW